MEVSDQRHSLAPLPLEKEPLDSRLGGPQIPSTNVKRNILSLVKIEAQSLYQAIPAHIKMYNYQILLESYNIQ
jgi:hypothetical protein